MFSLIFIRFFLSFIEVIVRAHLLVYYGKMAYTLRARRLQNAKRQEWQTQWWLLQNSLTIYLTKNIKNNKNYDFFLTKIFFPEHFPSKFFLNMILWSLIVNFQRWAYILQYSHFISKFLQLNLTNSFSTAADWKLAWSNWPSATTMYI